VACARVSKTRELRRFTTPTSFVQVACSLQFAKASSAATLPQTKKNTAEDLQRETVNITCFMYIVASKSSRYSQFGVFSIRKPLAALLDLPALWSELLFVCVLRPVLGRG